MNARSLLVVLAILGVMCIALTSRSTLTPKRGADHVFYGAQANDFISQELATGDFNGDGFDDIVTTSLWDEPDCTTWPMVRYDLDSEDCETLDWTTFMAENGVDTVPVCKFSDPDLHAYHWSYWACAGWDSIPGTSAPCDTCNEAAYRSENQGAALVFLGGNWSGKSHDINLASGGQDHMILGRTMGSQIYNAMAVGDMDGDGKAELALGAPGAGDAGEVYVIRGSSAWPDTIDLADPTHFDTWVLHYFIGRDAGDEFGLGVAMGDLNADDDADLVIVAPDADSKTGEAYVFYAGLTPPDSTIDLSIKDDNDISGYAQVIYGGVPGDSLGITRLPTYHTPHHGDLDGHPGRYHPIGVAIGDWDGDDVNDLALGAGHAGTRVGAAYVIFGGTDNDKLVPGNTIDLGNTPSGSLLACDIRIEGSASMALGAGLGFVDADDDDGYDDLFIGAPMTGGGGKIQRGNVFVIFGDERTDLMTIGARVRDVTASGHTDVKIIGEDANDQLGGHFTGGRRMVTDFDIDDDGKNDIGISGQKEMIAIFGQNRAAWEDSIDLSTVNQTYPDMRLVEFQAEQYARSTTIRFADLDGDNNHDLVFGGYDSPGYSPGVPSGENGHVHAGQMWVTKGQDLWKSGVIDANTTWSGSVFVHDDIVVEDGATLTISAGTDVWIWPKDPDLSSDVWPSYPLHFDTTRVEFRVYGDLVVDGAPGDTVNIQAWTMDGRVSNEPDLWWGIHVHDGSATFDYCTIRNARHALSANTPLTITNSIIEHAEIIGLDVAGTDSVYADHLTIRDVGYIGIKNNGMRVRVSDSDLSELGDYGIDAFNGAKLYVDNTTIRDADLDAISLEDEDTYASIVDCTFENNYGGLRAWDEALVVVEGSTFDASENYGIYSLDDATIGVEGCTVTNAVAGIAVVESNATLIGNLLQNCDIGLYSQASAPTVEGCDISYNYIGVLGSQGGLPMMGYGGGYGYNEIHHSTLYHVSNLTTADTLRAELNHWKITTGACFPASGKINGKVDYIPSLCSPPSPVSSQPAVPSAIPIAYGLSPNYPNPFNPVTTVPFAVPSPGGKVTIAIYNVRGQLVRTLVNGTKQPGHHVISWDGTNNQGSTLASGIYFLHMRAPGFQQTRKLALLK